jgi:hypothetical protein
MKYKYFLLVTIVTTFINNKSLAQKYENDSLNFLDTVSINGLWVQKFFSKPKKDNIDNPSIHFFIKTENHKKLKLKGIIKNYKSILEKNNALYFIWGAESNDFFYYYPSQHSKEKWGLVNPFKDCKLYKVNGKFIKTSFCEYKAYHKKVATEDLKKQLMIYQTYFSKSDTTDVYLFYKLISNDCFKSK